MIDTSDVRKMNMNAIRAVMWRGGEHTKQSIAADTGLSVATCNTLLAILTALTIVLGMRMMGAMLISSLIIFPALTSMRVCRTFKSVIINAAVISVVCLIAGVTLSYVAATPAGASVVLANLVMMVLYTIVGAVKNHMR